MRKHTNNTFLISLLFFKDRQDRFAQGQSFSKIDGIDSLKVDLFQRSTRAIRSRSIFLKEKKDRKIEFSTQLPGLALSISKLSYENMIGTVENRDVIIEEGWRQKQRQRSSRLFGGQILFNSLPRQLFCLGRFGIIG